MQWLINLLERIFCHGISSPGIEQLPNGLFLPACLSFLRPLLLW